MTNEHAMGVCKRVMGLWIEKNLSDLDFDGLYRQAIGSDPPAELEAHAELLSDTMWELADELERHWRKVFRRTWERRTGTTQRDGRLWFGDAFFNDWREMWDWWLCDRPLPPRLTDEHPQGEGDGSHKLQRRLDEAPGIAQLPHCSYGRKEVEP